VNSGAAEDHSLGLSSFHRPIPRTLQASHPLRATVTPAKAGVQSLRWPLDSRFRGNDGPYGLPPRKQRPSPRSDPWIPAFAGMTSPSYHPCFRQGFLPRRRLRNERGGEKAEDWGRRALPQEQDPFVFKNPIDGRYGYGRRGSTIGYRDHGPSRQRPIRPTAARAAPRVPLRNRSG
jgi:hypothetical protein